MPVSNYADLEISITPSAEGFAMSLRLMVPDIRRGPFAFALNLELLRSVTLDPSEYGAALCSMIFADTTAAAAFCECRAAVLGRGERLRVRLILPPEVHALRWETLRNPATNLEMACEGEVLLSRYLSGNDYQLVELRQKGLLKSLIAVAAPEAGSPYDLPRFDADKEVEPVLAALKQLNPTVLGVAERPSATWSRLANELRQGCDILYLVAHGAIIDKQPIFYLGDEQRGYGTLPASTLVDLVRGLGERRPRLVVLASCESAGDGSAEALTALGPLLAQAGVPAVLAMQGVFSIATNRSFAEVFFSELLLDGAVDRAINAARSVVKDRPDWWMPVLYTRLAHGRVWYETDVYTRFCASLTDWMGKHRRYISQRETVTLAAHIAACAAFQDEQARTALLRTLEPKRLADPHAMARLLDQLWLNEPGTPERDQVSRWLQEHPLDLLFKPDTLAELRTIFERLAYKGSGISIDLCRHCYSQALKYWGPTEFPDEHELADWLEAARLRLAGLEIRQHHPLITFATRLAELPRLPRELRVSLQSWAQRAAEELGMPLSPPEQSDESHYESYLCLIAHPSSQHNPSSIELHASFFHGGEGADVRDITKWEAIDLLMQPDEVHEPTDPAIRIARQIVRYLEQIQCRLNRRSLMIELFLPDSLWLVGRHLLGVKLKAGTSKFTRPLTARYLLAIRLLDRSVFARDSGGSIEARNEHRRRWKEWKARPSLDVAACHWVRTADECDPPQLFDKLDSKAEICCVVGLVEPSGSECVEDVAAAMRETGIPIALWVNASATDTSALEKTINGLLARSSVLPSAVQELWNEARTAPRKHPGHSLIMLWDNPNRPPAPTLELQPLR